jgi:hypothetical protein
MAAIGLFEQSRVELIEGQVVEMAAMNSPHAVTVDLAAWALSKAFGAAYYVRQQKPFVVSDIKAARSTIAQALTCQFECICCLLNHVQFENLRFSPGANSKSGRGQGLY